jgi:predicted secreted hydrolase
MVIRPYRFSRRRLLAWLAGLWSMPAAAAPITTHSPESGPGGGVSPRITPFARVVPGYKLRFPEDEGAHPDFRLEWWYVTGWLNEETAPMGFQVTFFRVRPELRHANPSGFAPGQILIAHAALSDPSHGRLAHVQRAARAGFGLAGAGTDRTQVWIDDWTLEQAAQRYRCRIPGGDVRLDLEFEATRPAVLQGDRGYSRKGPRAESASYYYSLPHLKVAGTVARGGKAQRVSGVAWLDHEWSSQYMEKEAVGWDWVGINFADGSALMAFRMRGKEGRDVWAGGTLRHPDGSTEVCSPGEIRFLPRREWKSGRSGVTYPVSFTVRARGHEFAIEPLFDDQEHDTRASTGTIYWEGAVRALREGKPAGLGYLELTGYWRRPDL